MSNQIKNMQKVLNLDEQRAQKQQIELQRQSFIVNTRLRLTETFLNTMLGRIDLDIVKEDSREMTKDFLIDLSLDYANGLMEKLGIVLPSTNVE